MKWIEYDYVCNSNKGITFHKKIEYSPANLEIAENESINGNYIITEDNQSANRIPICIEDGGTGANTVEGALNNFGIVPEVRTLLWENEDIMQPMMSGTIALDGKLKDFDGIEIVYMHHVREQIFNNTGFIPLKPGMSVTLNADGAYNNSLICKRTVSVQEDYSIGFSPCAKYIYSQGGITMEFPNNEYAILCKIYGIKYGPASSDVPHAPNVVQMDMKPLILYANDENTTPRDYLIDPILGDAALKAILEGRQILVNTPNADGGNYTKIFSPVLTYQLPNFENKYLYLFYLRDEKQTIDLSALGLGQIQVPVYGELKMLLSTTYNGCPLN